ncbi:uncharacterized protein LOC134292261 [Aedes albopictus]|uniref:Farnesoic acid O-methyl transferase domain-containing protein n=1 Tax=Aedes albopictus TaxID=7160 RepID=A0ABM1Y090_AEDAL
MRAIISSAFIALSLFGFSVAKDEFPNKFHSIYGCKQINAVTNYNDPVHYLPVEEFDHVGTGSNYSFFRLGVFGRSDAIIRLSKVPKPYHNNIVHEIAIGSGLNNFIEVRRQTRFNTLMFTNHVLKQVPTPNVLSETEPFVMRMDFFKDGSVTLTKDNETKPFLEFSDPNAEVNFRYIGFSNWLSKAIYFFDCPMYNFDGRVDKLNW